MPTKHFILAAGIAAIVVVLVVAITSLAGGTTYREASLTSDGMAYEVNADAAGILFISGTGSWRAVRRRRRHGTRR